MLAVKKDTLNSNALYSKKRAKALTKSEQTESWRLVADELKVKKILEHVGDAKSLLDIGCAWGQVLLPLVDHIPELAGVDESADRLEQLSNNSNIKTFQCRSSDLCINDESYDVVLTSHIMHELKLFGYEEDFERTLAEIHRVLKPGGRLIIIDHRDPGEGLVKIDVGPQRDNLLEFIDKFVISDIHIFMHHNIVTMSKRDCHEFVTKIWSLDTGMEGLEMIESHIIINGDRLQKDLEDYKYRVSVNESYNPITIMMDFYGIKLLEGDDWGRQIIIVANKE